MGKAVTPGDDILEMFPSIAALFILLVLAIQVLQIVEGFCCLHDFQASEQVVTSPIDLDRR